MTALRRVQLRFGPFDGEEIGLPAESRKDLPRRIRMPSGERVVSYRHAYVRLGPLHHEDDPATTGAYEVEVYIFDGWVQDCG